MVKIVLCILLINNYFWANKLPANATVLADSRSASLPNAVSPSQSFQNDGSPMEGFPISAPWLTVSPSINKIKLIVKKVFKID